MSVKEKISYFFSLEEQKPRYIFYLVFSYYIAVVLMLLYIPLPRNIIHMLFLPVIYVAVVGTFKAALLTNFVFLLITYLYEWASKGWQQETVNILVLLGGTIFSFLAVFLISHFKKQYIFKQQELSESMEELAVSYKNLEMTQSKLMALTWITKELLGISSDEQELKSKLIELLNRYMLYKNIAYLEKTDVNWEIESAIGFEGIDIKKIVTGLNPSDVEDSNDIIIDNVDEYYKVIWVPFNESGIDHGNLLILHKTDWVEEEDRYILDILRDHISLLFSNIKLLRDANKLAITDAGTNLYNQRYFYRQLNEVYEMTRKEKRPLSVIIFDVDNFKEINDEYGHLAGDKVLEELARILGENVRSNDVLARYGGDEFVIILPDADIEVAERISKRIVDIVNEKEFRVAGGNLVKTSLSGGITGYPQFKVDEAIELVQKADEALYHSKQHGKNRVIAYGKL